MRRGDPPTLSRHGGHLRPRSPAEALEPSRAPQRPRGAKPRRQNYRMGGLVRTISGVLTTFVILLGMLGGTLFLLNSQFNAAGPLREQKALTIAQGDGRIAIGTKLEQRGIISNRHIFVIYHMVPNTLAWLTGGKWNDLKAGEYEFAAGTSMRDVLRKVTEGKTLQYRVSIPEGLTSQQIVQRLLANTALSGTISKVPPEGSLLPDTYAVSKNADRQALLDRMHAEQAEFVKKVWPERQTNSPITTPEQALILASIVEKETGRADERNTVAGVFVNRLRKAMRLQSDPTIIYGVVGGKGKLDRPIYRSDIQKKTPYNTYQIDGLPPTPICNPGQAAIKAVLNPAETKALYFVADGTGGHVFSETLKQHNAAVANWRKVEKAMRDKAKAEAAAKKAQEKQVKQAIATTLPFPAAAKDSTATPLAGTPGAPVPANIPLPVRKPR